VRITLSTNFSIGKHWGLATYYGYRDGHVLGVHSVDGGLRDPRGAFLRAKMRAAAEAAGYRVSLGLVVTKFPATFVDKSMFWADFGVSEHAPTPGQSFISGMYPYDWEYIRHSFPTTLDAVLRETRYRGVLSVGGVTVPLFWRPYPHAPWDVWTLARYIEEMRAGTIPPGGSTMRISLTTKYQRQHKLPRGV